MRRIIVIGLMLAILAIGAAGLLSLAPMALRTAAGEQSMDPCGYLDGDVYRSRRFRDCLVFLPAERMRGVWYVGLEESDFIRNATSAPAVRVFWPGAPPRALVAFLEVDVVDVESIFRQFGLDADWDAIPANLETGAIAVDFIGRRSRDAGNYHGQGQYVVVVDRMISARVLGGVDTIYDCRDMVRAPQTDTICVPGTEGWLRPENRGSDDALLNLTGS